MVKQIVKTSVDSGFYKINTKRRWRGDILKELSIASIIIILTAVLVLGLIFKLALIMTNEAMTTFLKTCRIKRPKPSKVLLNQNGSLLIKLR